MDQLAVNVMGIDSVTIGDIATMIGSKIAEELSAPIVANNSDSISNELLCRMGA